MKNVRCCDCGWLLEEEQACTAPAPACVDTIEAERILSASFCLTRRTCDTYVEIERVVCEVDEFELEARRENNRLDTIAEDRRENDRDLALEDGHD